MAVEKKPTLPAGQRRHGHDKNPAGEVSNPRQSLGVSRTYPLRHASWLLLLLLLLLLLPLSLLALVLVLLSTSAGASITAIAASAATAASSTRASVVGASNSAGASTANHGFAKL